MATGIRLAFDPEFLTATDENGITTKFSRAERAILLSLSRRPGVILSRQRLLDAVAGAGSDSADRNIDFLINRLRRKLKDEVRAPRYIATQYGEGYWWVPQTRSIRPETAKAFMVIGPVRGEFGAGEHANRVGDFAQELRRQLDRQTAQERRVVLDADCPNAAAFPADKPAYAVELDVLLRAGRLDCAVTVRDFATGRVVHVSRQALATALNATAIAALAADLMQAIWLAAAYLSADKAAPSAEPLPLRMYNAGLAFTDAASWQDTERRLRLRLAATPNDHESQLMLATGIHSRFIMDGSGPFLRDPSMPTGALDEIEALTIAATPEVRHDAILTLAAAKLLYFVDRGHARIAVSMAEAAYATSTAIASSLAVVGQMRQYEGDIDGGAALLDEALAMCEPDDLEFPTYLVAIKIQGAVATGDDKRVQAAIAQLIAVRPDALPYFDYHCAAYLGDLSPLLRGRLDSIDSQTAAAHVRYLHLVNARLFKNEHHRANFLRGILGPLCPRLGTAFIADDIRRDVPSLLEPGGSLTPA